MFGFRTRRPRHYEGLSLEGATRALERANATFFNIHTSPDGFMSVSRDVANGFLVGGQTPNIAQGTFSPNAVMALMDLGNPNPFVNGLFGLHGDNVYALGQQLIGVNFDLFDPKDVALAKTALTEKFDFLKDLDSSDESSIKTTYLKLTEKAREAAAAPNAAYKKAHSFGQRLRKMSGLTHGS